MKPSSAVARRRLAQAMVLLALAESLVGCAGERKAFDTKASPSLDRILLPPAGQPTTYTALGGSPLFIFGPVGAIVGNNIEQTTHNTPFTDAARAGGIDLGTALTIALKDELTKSGHNVVSVSATSPRPGPNAFYQDYKSFAAGGDAVLLDAAIDEAGYRATSMLPFRPYMRVIVRLVDPATNQVIYADRFEVDPTVGTVGFRLIGRPDPDCIFETREQLMANVQDGDCLGREATLIARAVVNDLQGK